MRDAIRTSVLAVLVVAFGVTPRPASAQTRPYTMLQYFEASWSTMRYRMPDVFMAGYDSTWLPPPQRGGGPTNTTDVGYAVFDRFDLGNPTTPTRYGTESEFRQMIDAYHRANCYVFVDWIMNHNGTSDNDTPNFEAQGGYPGFVLSYGGDPYGDFHTKGTQSENPGGPNYNLYDGRLLGLIDIAQEKVHSMIRHPVAAGNPDNIPAGTLRNLPNANNVKFYPDLALTPESDNNPGTSRNPGPPQYTFYPFNPANPMAGDAVEESAAFLLLRTTQYYLEVLKVDGFRLDAAKHIPTWFWDNLWDASVYQRWVDFDGLVKTPYSFVEAVESNSNIANWVRKPGEPGSGWPASGYDYGNRDALEINESGALRDLVNNDGTSSWDTVMGASVDNVDGFNNGTIGVHHVNSHDNAIATGEADAVAQAYVLMRTGPAIVYHHAGQNGATGFPQMNGRADALGLGSSQITTLLKIRNQYARGWFIPLSTGNTDVLVFSRRTPSSVDNVLIGLNDSENNGSDARTVTTTFPQGTRLHELTGNAADPIVDPNSAYPELLTVGAGGSVTFSIPRNKNANGVFHGKGYVIYGPAVPTGTLSIVNASTVIAGPDVPGTPDYRERVNSVVMVNSATFDIQLQTIHTDPTDPDSDDHAVFRIDQGFKDYNNNGSTYNALPNSDLNPGNTPSTSPSYGFENFLTEYSPRYTGGTGTYRQTIDAAALGEGYHYITVRAYRHRTVGDPLFGEFRLVIYVDIENPDFELIQPTNTCNNDVPSVPYDFVVKGVDNTVDKVYMFFDLKESTDFIGLSTGTSNLASQYMDTFTRNRATYVSGNHRLDVVAFETLPTGLTKVRHKTFVGIQSQTGAGLGAGDVNADGTRNARDIQSFVWFLTGFNPNYGPAADMNCDGLNDEDDIPVLVDQLLQ
ncbi:MAG TPA: alpha-amylase family glycosyl hydrolase [Phycisphaerae bacterium]|nr:alpha-amylase family glycosyl hydrolase [Phycisphaerae bacterium]